MEKILFGCGYYGKRALQYYGDHVKCFIDNYHGGGMIQGVPVLSWNDYIDSEIKGDIIICVLKNEEVIKQLDEKGLEYEIYMEIAPLSRKIAHGNWINTLVDLCDAPGKKILEIGSRVVTGANFRDSFRYAEYKGFDFYSGDNVDVVGDAHLLSQYFSYGEEFDLIFSSAVFEHLAMPWKVAEEINKMLKVGGYVFVETHCSFSVHERPWHFFQFSDKALELLFSPAMGIKKIESGFSNPIAGRFTNEATPYLRGAAVSHLFCHSEFLGKKVADMAGFDWNKVTVDEVVNGTKYPKRF